MERGIFMTTTSTSRLLRTEVPKEETWNLSDLFPTFSDWEKELQSIQEDIDLVTNFKGKLTKDAQTLLQAIHELEAYQQRVFHVIVYTSLLTSADGTDPVNQSAYSKASSALANIESKLAFIESEILHLTNKDINDYIAEQPELENYRKWLNDILEEKPHKLSPEVEEALAVFGELFEAPRNIFSISKASDMQFESIFNKDGEEIPMSEALYEENYEYSEDTVARRNAYESFKKTFQQYKNTYATTYATEVTKQVKTAKLRNYNSVTDMLLSSQDVSEKMYENQLNVIQKGLAPHMRRYAKLLKEKLDVDELRYCDLKAPLDPDFNPKTTYKEGTDTILEALEVMGPEYIEIIKQGINNRWIDRSENVGKANGAFCSSPYGAHPYIMVTWSDNMRSTFILAHELGHAGHFYLAGKHQTLLNTRPSTYFVEAPSTLNELLLAEHLMNQHQDDPRMKRWIITQLLGTYYHNFITHLLEGEFQRRVYQLAEEGVPLTADRLCKEKQESLENFWGDTVVFDEGAGLTWMRQPHYYMGLYPYTYSAGLTVSTAVAKRIKEDGQPAVESWLNVLKSGGTKKPLDLIKDAGIDMSKPENIQIAVDYVGSLIDQLIESYE